jgi:23S rRNA U2552 (ribose-2'-O)-methylase RlmE/FtsJ
MATKSKNNMSREMTESYSPIVDVIVKNKKNIMDETGEINVSSNIDYPRFSFGFHHYIHANRNKMRVLSQFQGKKKVYYVMNEFEIYIDDYDEDIKTISNKFFSPRSAIITRSFYKMWEMCFYFDIARKKTSDFSSMHISDGPTSFAQAILYYRDMYCENKNDSYYALVPVKFDSAQQKDFQNKYSKSVKYFKDVNELCKGVKGRVDLITGDRGKEWNIENRQEQESFDVIFEQILCAVKKQKQGGNFVCKFFETFTITSLKFVAILSQLYDSVKFIKPLTSRRSNAEKYAVCMNFKLNEKEAQTAEIKLAEIYLQIKSLKKDKLLVDVFPNYNFDNEFKISMVNINKTVANEQLKSINQIIEYIEGTNYHGDVYIENRNKQIKASKFWCNLFLVPSKQIEDSIASAQDILNKDTTSMHEEYNRLLKVVNIDNPTAEPEPKTQQAIAKSSSKEKQKPQQARAKSKSASKEKPKKAGSKKH